jgi:hypothetical protein
MKYPERRGRRLQARTQAALLDDRRRHVDFGSYRRSAQ